MSDFDQNVIDKKDITDSQLAHDLMKNYKSLGRELAMLYLYQCDIADNGIPTDSKSDSLVSDAAILLGDEAEELQDTEYDVFWEQVSDPEVIGEYSVVQKRKTPDYNGSPYARSHGDGGRGTSIGKNGDNDETPVWGKGFDNTLKRARRYASKIIVGVRENAVELDEILARFSKKWDIQRMATIDRNIIRAAVYEMKYCPEIPPVVCITEAIKIGKIYGAENSKSFINGMLNAVMNELFPNLQKKDVTTLATPVATKTVRSGKSTKTKPRGSGN